MRGLYSSTVYLLLAKTIPAFGAEGCRVLKERKGNIKIRDRKQEAVTTNKKQPRPIAV